jgi:hypothetical protein
MDIKVFCSIALSIASVIPARPESFCIFGSKEGFPTGGNDKRNNKYD